MRSIEHHRQLQHGQRFSALYCNTAGNDNTANGLSALSSNTTGNYNTANGFGALSFNTTGALNTANGFMRS